MNFETAHAESPQRVPNAQKAPPSPHATVATAAPPRPAPTPATPVARQPDAPAAPRRSLWWVWLIVIVVVAAAGYLIYHFSHQDSGQGTGAGGKAGKGGAAGRPVPVVAVPAREGNLKIFLRGIGTVTPVSTVALHTRVDGLLTQVAYKQGQMVHHDPNYNDQSMADLDKGDQDKSDLLVEVDPRPYQVQLEQAKGQLARDQAQLNNAQLDLQRFTLLYGQKSATEQQLQTQQALVAQDQAVLQVDQAAIHNAELQLIYCHVRTPIDGRVGLRLVDVGNIVHASDTQPVAVVTQLQPITVEFTLPQDNIPQVVKSAPDGKGLLVEAWNRDSKVKLATGTLEAIDNQVDPGSGTILLRAEFDNKDNTLFPKQFVNARLLVDTLKNVVIVPSAAVQRSPTSTFVYVVKADETVAMQDVKVGPSEGDDTAIESGVTPGDVVVTDGVDKLVAGTKVVNRPPAGSGKGKGAATRPGAATKTSDEGGTPTTEPGAGPATGPSTGPATGPSSGTTPGSGRGHRHAG